MLSSPYPLNPHPNSNPNPRFVLLVEDMRRLGHDLAQSEMAKLRTELDEVRRTPATYHRGPLSTTPRPAVYPPTPRCLPAHAPLSTTPRPATYQPTPRYLPPPGAA